MTPHILYNDSFFADVDRGSARSAAIVVPMIERLFVPWCPDRRLVDVGCGTGAWSAVWQGLGWSILGIDGDYAAPWLAKQKMRFHAQDLTQPVVIEEKFDLALCLEVAEHLPRNAAVTLVQSLCRLSPIVVFSAAQPGQGGTGHINEQPLNFWRDLFQDQGFDCFDPVRPMIRGDQKICPWYRYNLLIFIKKNSSPAVAMVSARLSPDRPVPDPSSLLWHGRRCLLKYLPVALVNQLARLKNNLSKRTNTS